MPQLVVNHQPKKCFYWPLTRKNFPLSAEDWDLQVSKLQVALTSMVRDSRHNFPDIFDLFGQIFPKNFGSHWYTGWAKVLIISMQVWFYESSLFVLCSAQYWHVQKGKGYQWPFEWALSHLLSRWHFSWWGAVMPFILDVCIFEILWLNGSTEVVPNQLVNTNLCQLFVVFRLRVLVKLS